MQLHQSLWIKQLTEDVQKNNLQMTSYIMTKVIAATLHLQKYEKIILWSLENCHLPLNRELLLLILMHFKKNGHYPSKQEINLMAHQFLKTVFKENIKVFSELKEGVLKNKVDVNCCLCLDPLKKGDNVVQITGCKHLFHSFCDPSDDDIFASNIYTWLDQHRSCPMCRFSINKVNPKI